MTANELESLDNRQLTNLVATKIMGWFDTQDDSPNVISAWWWKSMLNGTRRASCSKDQWEPLVIRDDTNDVMAKIISWPYQTQYRFLMALRSLWLGITAEPLNDSIPCCDVLTLFMVPPKMICVAALVAVEEPK